MSVLCVTGLRDARETERAARQLLRLVPRVAVESDAKRVWADVRGLPREDIARIAALHLNERSAGPVRLGVADTPVAAGAAATMAESGGVTCVPYGDDRIFLATLPLDVLEPDPGLHALLTGVGIERCAALAALERESVEVRFGPDAVDVWRRARAEDGRRLFLDRPVGPIAASLDFVDYVVTDPERLLFTANALLGGICDTLRDRGAHARRIDMALPLANGEVWRHTIAPARPTANRSVWLRLVRGMLDRLTVPDAVAGMGFAVRSTEAAAAVQGDLFDAGFGTAAAVEAALARLVETYGTVLVQPETTAHPLAEHATTFNEVEPDTILLDDPAARVHIPAHSARSHAESASAGRATATLPASAELTLQILPAPRSILVQTIERRDHVLPVSYRDGSWRRFLTVEGPDRVSGGQWEEAYAREYYRGLTADGLLVWLFRDGLTDRWFLHGWWD